MSVGTNSSANGQQQNAPSPFQAWKQTVGSKLNAMNQGSMDASTVIPIGQLNQNTRNT